MSLSLRAVKALRGGFFVMSLAVEAYCIISAINAGLMLSGGLLVIVGKHALAQWRLNKPAQAKTP